MRTLGGKNRLALAAVALLAVTGCGGANPADVALITGEGQTPAQIGPSVTHAATPTRTPTPGAPVALRFVRAQPATIGVRGSGLTEQSTLTFQVTDALGAPVSGLPVDFSLVGVADESITPAQATTDANGEVTVTLTSGQRAASVQVTAEVATVTPSLIVNSTAVVILGGPPSQLHFSMAEQFLNISGRVTFGLTDQITAFVGDRFGNPVPPGTAVSFTTNGGVIGNLTTTNALGQATGTLVSQQPIPSNGIVTTLATTHGERPFIDTNLNGICDDGDVVLKVSEPFYDTNCNGVRDPGEDFIDLNGDQQFNDDQGSGTPACGDQIVVFDSICATFSGHTLVQLIPSDSGPVEAGGSRDFTLIVSDDLANPIVGGSTVSITVSGSRGRLLGPANVTLPDAETLDQIVDGLNRFQFSIADNAPGSATSETDALVVTVTSSGLPAGGNGSVTVTDTVTFLAAPPPSATPAPPPPPTPTPSAEAANIQVALFVNQASSNGDGTLSSVISALVTDANGATVINGTPVQFSLMAPVLPGVSVTSPGLTGQAAPCTLGFPVVAQPGDALSCVKYDAARQGETVTIQALVETSSGPLTSTQAITLPDLRPTATATFTATATATDTATPTPAAANIQIALFVNQASSNGDGTLSSIISALVIDATGAAVGNGVPVQFNLAAPVPAGVSVTSPGLTGQAAPCTLGFPVIAQPGDALSCVKYDTARQGQTITIQAVVQTPSGPLTGTQTIVLPDLRTPTPTSTFTTTPTNTATATPTATPSAANIQVALFVNQASSNGDGTLSSVISALVTDATGTVVGNGVPVQFSLAAPVPAGVSVTSPGLTGQAAPCTLGFPVIAQPGDALSCVKYDAARQGQTVTIQAVVQTPSGALTGTQTIILPDLRTPTPTNTPTKTPTDTPTRTPTPTVTPTATPAAAHIQVALFVNQASSNGDGTLSTVVSALVTDATGAVVGTGVPVQFSLVATPIPAGVSVTNPGLTGEPAPCTLGFPVVPQPGDALSCVKYDQALQGQNVTIQATVLGASGPLTSTQTIKLPDLRTPTPTATFTNTPTNTPTRTFTPTATATATPAAAHIVLALFVNTGCTNNDGTVSSVLSAVVTDIHGVAVGNGVSVDFELMPPVPAGVAVTSPGMTGAPPSCTLQCLAVQPQPGDALSCVKYDQALIGQTVVVQATVQTPTGPLADTETITLPAPLL